MRLREQFDRNLTLGTEAQMPEIIETRAQEYLYRGSVLGTGRGWYPLADFGSYAMIRTSSSAKPQNLTSESRAGCLELIRR
jgi:hypothetical protein